jgi:hypothetical protein
MVWGFESGNAIQERRLARAGSSKENRETGTDRELNVHAEVQPTLAG